MGMKEAVERVKQERWEGVIGDMPRRMWELMRHGWIRLMLTGAQMYMQESN